MTIEEARKSMKELNGLPDLPKDAVSFLDGVLKKSFDVLEAGSGCSTIWFAQRVKSVTAYEHSKIWIDVVREKAKELNLNNINLIFDSNYPRESFQYAYAPYDVILIDGRDYHGDRVACAIAAYPRLRENGYFIMDDIHRKNYYPAIRLLDSVGWTRKDFKTEAHPRVTAIWRRE